MNIYERRRQHLDSRLKVYLDDPKQRAFDSNPEVIACCYKTADGRKCFIGQDISDDKYDETMEGVSICDRIFYSLPDGVQELGYGFLEQCQELHDHSPYWGDSGLSELGAIEYNLIVNDYCTAPC